jgi:hypothetical protein
MHVFLTWALVGGEWSASRAGRFTPGERSWIRGCVCLCFAHIIRQSTLHSSEAFAMSCLHWQLAKVCCADFVPIMCGSIIDGSAILSEAWERRETHTQVLSEIVKIKRPLGSVEPCRLYCRSTNKQTPWPLVRE